MPTGLANHRIGIDGVDGWLSCLESRAVKWFAFWNSKDLKSSESETVITSCSVKNCEHRFLFMLGETSKSGHYGASCGTSTWRRPSLGRSSSNRKDSIRETVGISTRLLPSSLLWNCPHRIVRLCEISNALLAGTVVACIMQSIRPKKSILLSI